MNLSNVRILYRKEMTDFLRDKRTLISMVLAPLIVGPALMAGMGQYMKRAKASAKAERYQVGIQGQIPGIREAISQAGLELRDVTDARAAVQSKQVTFGVHADTTGTAPAVRIY